MNHDESAPDYEDVPGPDYPVWLVAIPAVPFIGDGLSWPAKGLLIELLLTENFDLLGGQEVSRAIGELAQGGFIQQREDGGWEHTLDWP